MAMKWRPSLKAHHLAVERSRVFKLKRALPLGLPAAAVLLVGCGAHGPASHPTRSSPTAVPGTPPLGTSAATLGRFAGYLRYASDGEPVTSVSATWTVPTIASGSQAGRAGTWVGTEAPGPPNAGPFIQIGTNEERHSAGDSGSDDYYTFWSDTARHFHPHRLFDVTAGDQISASVRLMDGHWMLSIHDATANETRRLATAQETAATFNEAQWVQEDITDARTGKAFSYPTLSPVRFSHLRFNGGPVSYADVYSQWMTLSTHRSLAPSPLASDAFTLSPQTLSAPAQRYLQLIAAPNRALSALRAQMGPMKGPISVSGVRPAAHTLSRDIRISDAGLARAQWPASARPHVGALIAAGLQLRRLLSVVPRHFPAQSTRWDAQLVRAENMSARAGHLVRRALHAPELP
jgi:Peptidase A4 family